MKWQEIKYINKSWCFLLNICVLLLSMEAPCAKQLWKLSELVFANRTAESRSDIYSALESAGRRTTDSILIWREGFIAGCGPARRALALSLFQNSLRRSNRLSSPWSEKSREMSRLRPIDSIFLLKTQTLLFAELPGYFLLFQVQIFFIGGS